jgi:hypothetical protein
MVFKKGGFSMVGYVDAGYMPDPHNAKSQTALLQNTFSEAGLFRGGQRNRLGSSVTVNEALTEAVCCLPQFIE